MDPSVTSRACFGAGTRRAARYVCDRDGTGHVASDRTHVQRRRAGGARTGKDRTTPTTTGMGNVASHRHENVWLDLSAHAGAYVWLAGPDRGRTCRTCRGGSVYR